MKYLFVDEDLLTTELCSNLTSAKEIRIKSQYYPNKKFDSAKANASISSASQFVLTVEELIEKLSNQQIEAIRKKLEKSGKV